MKKIAVIAGAGPAGLTAALEMLRQSDILPIVFEADCQVGGISKTINYRGNRIDLGGHRFFSKSDWVMRWWQEILPIAAGQIESEGALNLTYQRQTHNLIPQTFAAPSSEGVMLVRRRLSRIFFRRRFFDYPLKINATTLKNLGLIETLKIGLSYGRSKLRLDKTENTLEEFLINRFGDRLYRTFFKNYTEKVWGVPCRDISPEWGAQRIKGLSITKAVRHAIANLLYPSAATGIAQRRTETSLIEKFLYPNLGPGQMWEEVARQVLLRGGEVHLRQRIVGIAREGQRIIAVDVRNEFTEEVKRVRCDYFISSMPVRDLTMLLNPEDSRVATVAANLPYRDFITVGLLLRKMLITTKQDGATGNGMPPDNWIYIQEPDVKVGRLQIFNNWSPAMVSDPATIWLGLEYFCAEGDELWSMTDDRVAEFATGELEKLRMISRHDVLDSTVVRVPKAYPAYFGAYREFEHVREYLGKITNLYPIGRNGTHRYNNQDHSMLSASAAVKSILDPSRCKSAVWEINSEEEYQEEAGGR
jgi:protoporphyrinogen oxidase